MSTVYVRGTATWTEADGPPAAGLFPSRLRRRTSKLTRATAEVLGKLVADSAIDPGSVPVVTASAFGEIDTTIGLLRMMHEDDGALSPTRFHNSVHNTAAGYISIATGNRGFCTAVAAGPATVAAALLEAFALLHAQTPQVLVLVAEESIPEPFDVGRQYPPLAAALLLVTEPTDARQPRLGLPRRARPRSAPALPAGLARNPCVPVLGLVAACAAPEACTVGLEHGAEFGWCADVEPQGA